MLHVRFHGRGGQGMKPASRIVGTVAFHAGHYAPDARRGARDTHVCRPAAAHGVSHLR